ncbi:MAG TPA: hypothetical protein VFL94_07940 [Actinomycetales bacterium]|nr:hypothetical protein [Actinomycetales bacterium]
MAVVTALSIVQVAPAFADTSSSGAPTSQSAAAGAASTGVDPSKTDAPAAEAPKAEAPKADAPKADAPKADAPKADAPKAEAPKADAPTVPATASAAPAKETTSSGTSAAAPAATASSGALRTTSVVGASAVVAAEAEPAAPLAVTVTGTVVDVNGSGRTDAGDGVDLVATVTNAGPDSVQALTVTTDGGASFTCPVVVVAPGTPEACTLRHPLTQADVDAGRLVVLVTASGTVAGSGTPVTSAAVTSSTPVTAASGLAVKQTITQRTDGDKDGRLDAGDQVDVRITVTNTGALTLRGLTVSDALLSRLGVKLTCGATQLAPGASATCTSARFAVTDAQAKAGTLRNQATASATTLAGATVTSATSTASVPVQVPAARPQKPTKPSTSPSGSTAVAHLHLTQWVARVADRNQDGTIDAGDLLTFAFRATNTGTLTLTHVQVVDRRLSRMGAGVYCPVSTLAPGASVVCMSAPVAVTKWQAAKGFGRNFAYATGRTPSGATVRSNSSVTTVGTTVRSAAASASALPRTGADPREPVLLALALLLGGVTLTVLSRRATCTAAAPSPAAD